MSRKVPKLLIKNNDVITILADAISELKRCKLKYKVNELYNRLATKTDFNSVISLLREYMDVEIIDNNI